MYIKQLQVNSFKNHEEVSLSFKGKIVCFAGKNGCGKTNLLDAIYLLCMTKSAFSHADIQCVKQGNPYFFVSARTSEELSFSIGYQTNKRKICKIDDKVFDKITEYFGKFPAVIITPDDTLLVREGSEERRKFFDSLLSQLDNSYLEELIRYNYLLKQRNELLNKFYEGMPFDADLLESYDNPILQLCRTIAGKRNDLLINFLPIFNFYYSKLTNEAESIGLQYLSKCLDANFEQVFRQQRSNDLAACRTTLGIHKDDFDFLLGENSLKKFGSQGQQKSYVIALKITQFILISQKTQSKPLLLLDDIFDKLDDYRIASLLEMIANDTFGQIFLTDARPERTRNLFGNAGLSVELIDIEQLTLINSLQN